MSFYITSINFKNLKIPLWREMDNNISSANRYTILIGRNGMGKSRMLAEICRIFKTSDSKERILIGNDYRLIQLKENNQTTESKSKLNFVIDDQNITLSYRSGQIWNVTRNEEIENKRQLVGPKKVIAITVSPFDKFPVDINYKYPQSASINLIESRRRYRYIGSKDSFGQVSSKGMLRKVIDSLVITTAGNFKLENRVSKLLNVFKLLNYKPNIILEYKLRTNIPELHEFYTALNQDKHNELLQCAKNIINSQSFWGPRYRRPLLEDEIKLTEFTTALISLDTFITKSSRVITLDLDLEKGLFINGSLKVFEAIKFLQKIGLLLIGDLYLFKTDSIDTPIRFSDASSGEQSTILTFLGIASEIEDNSLIIIDEPEISLHPDWQEKFIQTLTHTFSIYQGCHFILATHSPLILAKAVDINGVVVTMEDKTVEPLADYTRRSADFQLATAFDTPGYKNEYLIRESLSALQMAGRGEIDSIDFQKKIRFFEGIRPKLEDDDPVAQLVDALLKASKIY